jgi:SAM-dependent methyltransferase
VSAKSGGGRMEGSRRGKRKAPPVARGRGAHGREHRGVSSIIIIIIIIIHVWKRTNGSLHPGGGKAACQGDSPTTAGDSSDDGDEENAGVEERQAGDEEDGNGCRFDGRNSADGALGLLSAYPGSVITSRVDLAARLRSYMSWAHDYWETTHDAGGIRRLLAGLLWLKAHADKSRTEARPVRVLIAGSGSAIQIIDQVRHLKMVYGDRELSVNCVDLVALVDLTDEQKEDFVRGKITFVKAAMTSMDFVDASFDVVVVCNALTNEDDFSAGAEELMRVLSLDGVILFAYHSEFPLGLVLSIAKCFHRQSIAEFSYFGEGHCYFIVHAGRKEKRLFPLPVLALCDEDSTSKAEIRFGTFYVIEVYCNGILKGFYGGSTSQEKVQEEAMRLWREGSGSLAVWGRVTKARSDDHFRALERGDHCNSKL